tara:strand:+ start:526 stop:990 length:465 start_codon:yes stop_codon:yes gene_type:complete
MVLEIKPDKRKSPKFRIYLDTREFSKLWMKTIADKKDWFSFLDACWELGMNDPKTIASINEYAKDSGFDPKKWNQAQIHNYISPKAYTKCQGIRKRMEKYYDKHNLFPEDGAVVPELPRGAKQFLNKDGSDRPSTEDLLGLFQIEIKGFSPPDD